MTAATTTAKPEAGPGSGRTQRWLRKRVVQIVLSVIALLWLVPGIGHFVTSLRPVESFGDSGWWSAFTHPAEFTLQNYSDFLGDSQLLRSVWNTVLIAAHSGLSPRTSTPFFMVMISW